MMEIHVQKEITWIQMFVLARVCLSIGTRMDSAPTMILMTLMPAILIHRIRLAIHVSFMIMHTLSPTLVFGIKEEMIVAGFIHLSIHMQGSIVYASRIIPVHNPPCIQTISILQV